MSEKNKVVDVREDAEQEKKCQEVLELLVAAGYFRARIKVRFVLKKRRNCYLNFSFFLLDDVKLAVL